MTLPSEFMKMTTDEALKSVQDFVQECRERGEGDLRCILSHIKDLRKDLAEESNPESKSVETPKP